MKGTSDKFGKSFDQLVNEKDPAKHRKAIVALLSNDELDGPFLEFLHEKDGVERFFLSFTHAEDVGIDAQEKKSLKKLGKLSKKYFEHKEYVKLCELFYGMAFRNLADILHLQDRDDFETITDHDLITKGILPSEILLPYFLLDAFVQIRDFDWNRGEEVVRQNLACFIVCFTELYAFFNESEEEEDFADEPPAFATNGQQKVGRNDPCPCQSGMKWKKCCGSIERPRCGLCGKSGDVVKTDCCGNLICNDEGNYVLFSYDRNSCSRNHRRFTLCGYHHTEQHAGDWTDCNLCRDDFVHELEMYVWYGTNEYNFTKLQNPPAFTPTYCGKCGKRLVLPDGGFSSLCGEYRCNDCPVSDEERKAIIEAYKQKNLGD